MRKPQAALVTLATLTALAGASGVVSTAEAACRPPAGLSLEGDLRIQAQVLVAPEAAQPWVMVRCHLQGPLPPEVWLPLTESALTPQVVGLDTWDDLWGATAPRAIQRSPPSAALGELPEHDLDPPVIEDLSPAPAPLVEARVEMGAATPEAALPEAAQAVLRLVLEPPGEVASAGVWTPIVRLPLGPATDAGTVSLPLLPETELVVAGTGRVFITTTLLVLGVEQYWGTGGFDLWGAIDREPGALAQEARRSSPHPALVIPDQRVVYARPRPGGFAPFYERRVAEVSEGAVGPVAVLQYASRLGSARGLLPRPEPVAWHTAATRVTRLRLDAAGGGPITLTPVSPVLYLPVWIARPATEEAAPAHPGELELSGDAQLFGFGAERLGELTATSVRRTIDEHDDRFEACHPQLAEPLPVELQFTVEPGGTIQAVFVDAARAEVAECLIDSFTDLLFPLAAGSPVAARFQIVYHQSQ